MGKFFRKLRIGEKIGFGFGIVGLLFLGVIWQYHDTLQRALVDYRQLDDLFDARKVHALTIEIDMLEAQRAEKRFVLTRNESFARQVAENLEQAHIKAAEMGGIGQSMVPVAERMKRLIQNYGQRFQDVADAWRIKGLDHNSGLQGAFRDTVHELETMAGRLEVDRLYLLLLQIRRAEKDMGLRREVQYRDRVRRLIEDFGEEAASSELEQGVRARLFHEIETYRETFEAYALEILDSEKPHDGKGPFRQAAHRIEDLLNTHYVYELGKNILQLRRREKDYLLRDDKRYVELAIRELNVIKDQVEASAISKEDGLHFLNLLGNYRRDFLALVEQNDRIGRLNEEMRLAVAEIERLVRDNVDSANESMARMRAETDAATSSDEVLMLWVVAVATAFGVFLTFAITLPIVRPLREMAGLLDQLASEVPAERIPYYPGGRDEVNAMAGSVNAIADHKAGFIAWWKASMREADACGRLEKLMQDALTGDECRQAADEIRDSVISRRKILSEQYHKVHRLNGHILEKTDELLADMPSGRRETALNGIRYSAKSVQTILEMASFPEDETRVD